MSPTAPPSAPAARVRTRRADPPPVKSTPVHISGATVPDCLCELSGIDTGVVCVRSERQIPESSAVVISFGRIQLSGVVAETRPTDEAWLISIALSSCRRRLDERIPHGSESVLGIVENGQTTLHPCTVIDTSTFGLGLRLSFPVDTGARICVETDSMMVFGEVRHCRPALDTFGSQGTATEYIAGVLIVDVVPDVRTQTRFSVMLNNLRWKLASGIRGREIPVYRAPR